MTYLNCIPLYTIISPTGIEFKLRSSFMPEEHTNSFLVCDRCGTATTHSILCLAESDIEYSDAEGFCNVEPAIYRLLRCNGCMRISLYVWSHLHSPHTEIGERQYPSETRYDLPPSVKAAYAEARKVKRQSAAAYGIMVRRVLEAVSRDRGVNNSNLALSLTELVRREQISPRLNEAITMMRKLGNVSAHDPGKHIMEHHSEIIDIFLNALLDHIYLLPSNIDFFKLMDDSRPNRDDS